MVAPSLLRRAAPYGYSILTTLCNMAFESPVGRGVPGQAENILHL